MRAPRTWRAEDAANPTLDETVSDYACKTTTSGECGSRVAIMGCTNAAGAFAAREAESRQHVDSAENLQQVCQFVNVGHALVQHERGEVDAGAPRVVGSSNEPGVRPGKPAGVLKAPPLLEINIAASTPPEIEDTQGLSRVPAVHGKPIT